MLSEGVQTSSGVVESKTEPHPSLAAVMVHVDLDHDCEPRIELAMGLADRFRAMLIGVAGCEIWPAFVAGSRAPIGHESLKLDVDQRCARDWGAF
jgi:hypothetical protein